jgi:hypothetical protein
MKTPQKKSAVIAVVLSVAVVTGITRAQAQQTVASGTTSSGDSIVALAADSQSLLQVAPAQVPVRGGTFWWVYPGGMAVPTPMLPLGSSGRIYSISPDEYLVDLTGGTVMVTPRQLAAAGQTANPYATAVTGQVQGLMNLITFVQTPPTATTTAMTLSAKPMGGSGGFSPDDLTQSGGYPYLTIAPTGTNQLLISVIDTNASTYYLQMTPVLANTNYPFAIIANGVAGQTNFTVNIGPFDDEFFRVLVDTNNPGQGIAVFIDSPANGASVQ